MKQMFGTDNYVSRCEAWSRDIICAPWPVNRGKNTGIYILHEQETIFSYDQRIREVKTSIFTPPALSTGVWEEPPQSYIRDLLQC